MPYHGAVPLPLTRSHLTVLLDDGLSWLRGAMVNQPGRTRDAWMRVIAGLAGVALVAVSTSLGATIYDGMLVLVFVLALIHSGALVLTLVRPPVAAVFSVLASFGLMLAAHSATGAPWPWAVTTMITQVLVIGLLAYRAQWVLGAATFAGSVLAAAVAARVIQPSHELNATAVNMVIFASIAGAALAAGIVLRQWGVIRSQLAVERRTSEEERTRRVLAEEKTRIARELHDVIAHSMSIINVQASSAPFRHPQADEALRQEFKEISESSRRALAEMRSLLGVLRDETRPADRAPQPVLSRIPELVEQSVTAGLPVRLEGGDCLTDEGVSELTGLAAYRIVQEALSNVIRHAPGAEVVVECSRDDERIELVVRNGRSDRPGTLTGEPGHGLVGMTERAASVGGTVEYGPTDNGGYKVRAVLPLRRAEP